jgi:hypothetical protein
MDFGLLFVDLPRSNSSELFHLHCSARYSRSIHFQLHFELLKELELHLLLINLRFDWLDRIELLDSDYFVRLKPQHSTRIQVRL